MTRRNSRERRNQRVPFLRREVGRKMLESERVTCVWLIMKEWCGQQASPTSFIRYNLNHRSHPMAHNNTREFVIKKRKLKAAKRKRHRFSAEVRFLRQRRKILCRIKDSTKGKCILHLQNLDEESNAVEGERNHSASEAAAGNSDAILVSNSHMKSEEGVQHQVLENEPRFANGPNSGLIHDKVVGKRKISQHDQYTLQ